MPNDRSAFDATILPHLPAAYNLARWLLRNDSDAHDVLQESSMRALQYFNTLRSPDALPWLLRIVRNTAFTFLERRRPHDALQPLDLDAPDPAAPDPAALLSQQVDAQALRTAVENLPPAFREVIVLRELEGLSYKQIAAATDVSVGTVMSRLARARSRLQLALAPNPHQEHHDGL